MKKKGLNRENIVDIQQQMKQNIKILENDLQNAQVKKLNDVSGFL
jgi:hypothetical protein